MVGRYTVQYDERTSKFIFSNSAQRFDWYFVICSKEAQLVGEEKDIDTIPRIIDNNGAWKLLGMEYGSSISGSGGDPVVPGIANSAPNLQFATQMFIKIPELGITGQSLGAKGNMSILRRVVVGVPTFGLIIDRHSTSWDSFQIPGNTTISSFTVQLCDYQGNIIDLNGQNWRFSISIFREDF